jgi:cbb3-type cytochrome oxidase maturation protein
MNILLVLIPVTVLVIVIAVALFFWAVNHQQFDDLDNPGVLPLMDDPAPADTPVSATGATPAAPATPPPPADRDA